MNILKLILCCIIGGIISKYIPSDWQYIWGFIVASLAYIVSQD